MEAIYRDEKETFAARPNENLRLRVTGADEADIQAGFVLSSIKQPVPVVTTFEAQMQVGGAAGACAVAVLVVAGRKGAAAAAALLVAAECWGCWQTMPCCIRHPLSYPTPPPHS